MHQIKVKDIPMSKLREKGIPIDNISKFDGSKEEILYLSNLGEIIDSRLMFATKMALIKLVPGDEFITITEQWQLPSSKKEMNFSAFRQ